jgi:type III secretion protein S
MEVETLVRLTTEGMLLCLYVSLPIIGIAALVGLGISFIQAITSLQDHTISFAVKLIAVIIGLAVLAPWGAASVLNFANEIMAAAVPS